MAYQRSDLTIVFADIRGSTELFERYGDTRARNLEASILAILVREAKNQGGRVVKTIGDEVMCAFTDPGAAVQAACNMQLAVSGEPDLSRIDAAVRIGLHHGEVLLENNDVFGDTVNIAARMVSVAKGDQIITTLATMRRLPSHSPVMTRGLGRIAVRGKQDEMEIIEVIWQEDQSELTIFPVGTNATVGMDSTRLVLRYRDRRIEMGPANPTLTLGREAHHGLRIDHRLVSRDHGVIEFRQGRFVLTDHSTNGTYLHGGEGEVFFVHRDSFQLHGAGDIGFGQPATSGDGQPIRYACENG